MGTVKGNSHKGWAGDKKPSMHRRAEWHDYTSRRIYMITMATHKRIPCLGELVYPDGWQDAVASYSGLVASGSDTSSVSATFKGAGSVGRGLTSAGTLPFIRLSPLGEMVTAVWNDVIGDYSQIESICLQIMPDHIHAILFVKNRLPLHFGKIIGKFKLLTSKKVDEVLAEVKPRPTEPISSTSYSSASTACCLPASSKSHSKEACLIGNNHNNAHIHLERLWEDSYHDRILDAESQLETMKRYVHENPLRLAVKRWENDLFIQKTIEYAGYSFKAVGNINLLYAKQKQQVRCSRIMTEELIQEAVRQHLDLSKNGYVMVSPCISKGEQAIARSTRVNGYPLIVILENGFSEYYKPSGEYFYSCAKGKLLMIAPWKHHNEKHRITREECIQLNEMAEKICNG